MITTRRTHKQKKEREHNNKHFVIYLTSSQQIAISIKNNINILRKINPRWKCLSHYFNYCLHRDFGAGKNIKDIEKQLKEILNIERTELRQIVSEYNINIDILEKKLEFLQTNNKAELGILKKPIHKD